MIRKRQKPTFEEMLREAKRTAPAAIPMPEHAEPYGEGVLMDPQGRVYTLVDEDITSRRAFKLAAAGAVVVWDSCGCGGYCGLDWFDNDDIAKLVASGPPTIGHKKRARGRISEWRAQDGQALLLADDAVRWGDLLS